MPVPVLTSRRPDRLRLQPPAVPTGFTATAGTGANVGKVLLACDPTPGADGYQWERSPAGMGTFTVLTSTASPAYTDNVNTSGTPGTAYTYRVRSKRLALVSLPSATQDATALDHPSLITGYTRHWDANQNVFSDTAGTVPQTTDASPVACWTDLVAGDKATQATVASQPWFETAEINGLPAIRFDGGDVLVMGTGLTLSGAHSVFIVGYWTTGTTGIVLGSTGTNYVMYFQTNSMYYYDGAGPTAHAGVTGNTYHCFESNRTTTPTWFGFQDGSQLGAEETVISGAAQALGRIGNRGGATLPFTGRVAAIIIYNRLLTGTEFARVRAWVSGVYGITMALPPGVVSAAIYNYGQDADGQGRVKVVWSEPSGSPTGYNIYTGTTSGSLTLYANVSNTLEYVIHDLTLAPPTPLYVQIAGSNGVGEGNRGPELTITPAALPAGMPTGLELAVDAAHVYKDLAMTLPATVSGDVVNAWADQSGNGRDCILNAAATPGTLGSWPYDSVKKVALSTSVYARQGPALTLDGDFTMLAVLSHPLQDSTPDSLVAPAEGTAWPWRYTNNRTEFSGVGSGSLNAPDLVPPLSIRTLVVTQRQGTLWRTSENQTRWTVDQACDTGTPTVGFIGGRSGNTSPWRGDLTALYIYRRALSSTEIAQAYQHIQSTWGTPGLGSHALAFGHSNQFQFHAFPLVTKLTSGQCLVSCMEAVAGEGTNTGRVKMARSPDCVDFHEQVFQYDDATRDDRWHGMAQLPVGSPGKILVSYYGTLAAARQGYFTNSANGDAAGWSALTTIASGATYTGQIFFYGSPIYLSASDIRLPAYAKIGAGNWDSILYKSTDGGVSWAYDRQVMVNTSATLQYSETTIISQGGTNYLAIARSGNASGPLYYATSTDACQTWSAPALWEGTPGTSQFVSPHGVRMASGNIVVAWGDRAASVGIRAKMSTDNGSTWGPVKLLWTPSTVTYPCLWDEGSGKVGVAFTDARNTVRVRGILESELL